MKLWILLSRVENGGLERVQANLAPAFARSGIEVWIVAGKFLAGTENMVPRNIASLEIAQLGKLVFIPNLLKQLRLHSPDVVMTTSNDVACLMLAFRALFFPKMKIICTQHLSLSAPWRNSRGLQRIKQQILIWLMQHSLPKADAIIAVSSALAGDIRRTLKLRADVHTIHNPIVLPNFKRQSQQPILWPWSDNGVATIVFAGRLAKVKRLDVLLDAFLKVSQTRISRLLILGDGPERGYVTNFINKNGLNGVCHMAGHQENPLPWMKASCVLVLPSDYEGFGNVLVEAMACGTQVIATDCPYGPAEILGKGQYGQLVPTGDSNSLARAMLQVISKDFHVPTEALVHRANEFNLAQAANAYLLVIQKISNKP